MWVVCGCAGCELVVWLHSHVQGLSDGVYVGGLCPRGWSVCTGCELVAWLHSHVQGLSNGIYVGGLCPRGWSVGVQGVSWWHGYTLTCRV